MKNFSSKLKLTSQFQVIFGQDSFPLKMSPFQVCLLHNLTNCLLANGWWNPCFYHYPFFTKKFSISSPQALGLSEDISLLSNSQLLVFSDYCPVFPHADSASYNGYIQNVTFLKHLTKFI